MLSYGQIMENNVNLRNETFGLKCLKVTAHFQQLKTPTMYFIMSESFLGTLLSLVALQQPMWPVHPLTGFISSGEY